MHGCVASGAEAASRAREPRAANSHTHLFFQPHAQLSFASQLACSLTLRLLCPAAHCLFASVVALDALQHILKLGSRAAFEFQLHARAPWVSSPHHGLRPTSAHLLCLRLCLPDKLLQPSAQLRLLFGRGRRSVEPGVRSAGKVHGTRSQRESRRSSTAQCVTRNSAGRGLGELFETDKLYCVSNEYSHQNRTTSGRGRQDAKEPRRSFLSSVAGTLVDWRHPDSHHCPLPQRDAACASAIIAPACARTFAYTASSANTAYGSARVRERSASE